MNEKSEDISAHQHRHQRNILKLSYLKEEIELLWEEEELGWLIESLPVGICITDPQGRFYKVNEAYTQLYAYPREEMLGQHFTMIVPEDEREDLAQIHDRFIENEHKLKDVWRVRRKGGGFIDILANAARLELGDHIYKMTFVVDISDQRETERKLTGSVRQLSDELRSLQAAQSMFVHDLRNSISNIAQMSELVSKHLSEEEEKSYYLHLIRSQSLRTLAFLDMLVSLQRMESGVFTLKPESIDLKKLLEDCREAVALKLQNKQIPLHISVDQRPLEQVDSVSLQADPLLIVHAIDNLLQNAIEASPKGMPIFIEIENVAGEIHLRFRNQGMVPPQIRAAFFDKYATAGKSKGSGLGTYIARLVTESHQGNISMNTSEENGTEIIMRLPQKQTAG